MIAVVFDCNVILAAIGWRGTARLCLKLAAKRRVSMCVTEAILAEYETVIPERLKEEIPALDPKPKLAWIRLKSQVFEPVPLGASSAAGMQRMIPTWLVRWQRVPATSSLTTVTS